MSSALDHVFKILLVGDTQVGKSSLLLQFTDSYFNENLQSTIGVDFKVKVIDSKGPDDSPKRVKVTIWDTAGQERFRTLTSSYYRGAQGVICVFDVNNKDSFRSLPRWIDEMEQFCMGGATNVIKYVVGNKTDQERREVTAEDAKAFADSRNMKYVEVSSKQNSNVADAFRSVVRDILAGGPATLTNTVPATAKSAVTSNTNAPMEIPVPTCDHVVSVKVTCPVAPKLSGVYRGCEPMMYFEHIKSKLVFSRLGTEQMAIYEGTKCLAVSSAVKDPSSLEKAVWKVQAGDSFEIYADMMAIMQEGEPTVDSDADTIEERYATILRQIEGLSTFTEWLQRKDAIDARYQAARTAKPKNYALVASVGLELQAVKAEGWSMAEEDFLSLPQRREEVLQEMEALCEKLEDEENFAQLKDVAEALTKMQAQELSGLPKPPVPPVPPNGDSAVPSAAPDIDAASASRGANSPVGDHFQDPVSA